MRENLRRCRVDRGWTQLDVANILNISEKQYYRIENGYSNGTIKVWLQLRELFKYSIDYLLEDK